MSFGMFATARGRHGGGGGAIEVIGTARWGVDSNTNPQAFTLTGTAEPGDVVVFMSWGASTQAPSSFTGFGLTVTDYVVMTPTSSNYRRLWKATAAEAGNTVTFNTLYRGGAFGLILRGADIDSLTWVSGTSATGASVTVPAGGVLLAESASNSGSLSISRQGSSTPASGWVDLTSWSSSRSSAGASYIACAEETTVQPVFNSGGVSQLVVAAA